MGVSLQVYRCRIGSFTSTSFNLSKTINTATYRTSNSSTEIILFLVLLSSLLVFVNIHQQLYNVASAPTKVKVMERFMIPPIRNLQHPVDCQAGIEIFLPR